MTIKKKVIVTGATGLIGKEVLKPLQELGYEIYALTTKDVPADTDINWKKCDIFFEKSLRAVFEEVKPSHLLNLAWTATGDYLNSQINFDFVKAGLSMLKYFKENNGKRAVFAGTCFEYKFKDAALIEADELNPQTIYAKCKNNLREQAEKYSQSNDISFGWGRIFYVYGIGENEKRLTAHLVNRLSKDKIATIQSGQLIKDYMYTKDIASAFAAFLDSETEGCVNICTGKGISLGDYSAKIAEKLGKTEFLKINREETAQPPVIVGDNSRLINEVGFKPLYSLDTGIDEILNHWTDNAL